MIQRSKIIHLLPRFVPNQIVLAYLSLQTVMEGVHGQIHSTKRGSWPKFPLYIGHLVIQNESYVGIITKEVLHLKLGWIEK